MALNEIVRFWIRSCCPFAGSGYRAGWNKGTLTGLEPVVDVGGATGAKDGTFAFGVTEFDVTLFDAMLVVGGVA